MSRQGPRRPNVLVIPTDQQRFDTIGALGNPVIRTPNVALLVRDGTAFTNTYTPRPGCMPRRFTSLTGIYPHRGGCVSNRTPLPR